ncbi:helicase-exonuclease AddAB subunit AddB [Paenibacillus chartarius]|uniref:ATP-dependent helicase/deoxyribonuclease subunit B n=1 Tax=Paenibacillus chartarius TaxID=747481 RepID=A0ABV6DHE7_9BACL
MGVRWIIGRAGSGKTQRCLDEVRQRLVEEPDGHPLILLVPEQATFQAEYALVGGEGLQGMIRAQAISFHRLAWRIMQEEGGTARVPIDEVGKKLLLHKLLHKHRGELRYFHKGMDKMGFAGKLNELVTELKRYGVSAEQLESFAEREKRPEGGWLEDKLHDVRLLYRGLESELSRQYLDGEDVLELLIRQTPHSELIRSADIWIDGFHGLTPMELTAVEKLMQHARSVTMTLTLDRLYEAGEPIDELELFHKPARTCVELQQRLAAAGVKIVETVRLPETGGVSPRYRAAPVLAHLERNFEHRFGRHAPAYPAPSAEEREQLVIRAAANRRAEVEGAARDMIRLAREHGVRWRDMAVMIRDTEGYKDLIQTTFTDYGIPFFIDEKRHVLHHPLVELIRSAMEVTLRGWPYDAVFRCVKTDLLLPEDADGKAFEPDELRAGMDKLENVVLAYGVYGSRWTDGLPWGFLRRAGLDGEAPEMTARKEREERLVEACRAIVVGGLHPFEKRMKAARTVLERTEALMELLLGLRVPEKLERWSELAIEMGRPAKAREHSQLWARIMDMLDQLVELTGEEEVTTELFASLLDEGFESMKLGLVPPSLDQVLVGSMDRTRSGEVKYAYLLGVSDGVVPAKLSEDGVLTEQERVWLIERGLPLAEDSRRKLLDEQFIIYTALAVPSRRLWISYPQADEEGKAQLPSEIVPQLRPLFPAWREQTLAAEPNASDADEAQALFASRPARTLSHLAVQLKRWLQGERVSPVWWAAYDWLAGRTEWRERLDIGVRALFYTNREQKLSDASSLLLYGERLQASVSRMETFAGCPFSHFASYGLRLKERRLFRLEAPDIGQLYHATLDQFASELQQQGLDWGTLPPDELQRRTSAVVDALAPQLQGQILLSSNRFGYIKHKLTSIVGRAAEVLGQHARRGEFRPVQLEAVFGPGQPLPALTLPLDNGRIMDIVGRIDRVDSAELGDRLLLRVIDYKSGPTQLVLPEVLYGLSLQMLTYLDVVVSNAKVWLGRDAEPAGVLYFHVHNPLILHKNRPQPDEAAKELRRRFKMRGLVTADPDIVRAMDSELKSRGGYSELIPAALKADGGFYSASSVVTPQQWTSLREQVRGQIKRIGTDITDGKVAIEPYRLGKKTPCQMCAYRSVCQFEPLGEENGYRVLRPLSKGEVWNVLEGDGGNEQGTGI